jgi:hypothetical protein
MEWQQSSLGNERANIWQKACELLFAWLWRNRWLQEGAEVVGHNNLSLVKFQWPSLEEYKAVIQETYWHPSWNETGIVKSSYFVSLKSESSPPPKLRQLL